MTNAVEESLKNIMSSLQAAKIYPLNHPNFISSIAKAYDGLKYLLSDRDELVVGIIGDELAFEKEIFFDLARTVKPLLEYLKRIGIERIAFRKNISQEELIKFVAFLLTPREELGADMQKHLTSLGVENIAIGKLRVGVSLEKEVAESISYISQYEESLKRVSRTLELALDGEELDYLDLKYAVTEVLDKLSAGYDELLKLTILKKRNLGTFAHLLDVSIIAMYFSSKIGFAKGDVLDIGTAALLHDIGKLYISRKILDKPEKLSEEEFRIIRNHTSLGAEILLRYTGTLGILPCVVAFEHHLRYDSKGGYFGAFFQHKPHIASFIVCLCDVYDALNERRSYKRSYPPDVIYNLMLKEKGKLFEPGLFEQFFGIIGVWPAGSVVYLNDKRVAVVREQNDSDIFSPKVEVIYPVDKKEFLDLKNKELGIRIDYAVNLFDEAAPAIPYPKMP